MFAGLRCLKLGPIINRTVSLQCKNSLLLTECRFIGYWTLNTGRNECKNLLKRRANPVTNFEFEKVFTRFTHSFKKTEEYRTKSVLMYLSAVAVLIIGLSYAAVPMYRIFCQATSYGGETARDDGSKLETLKKIANRQIKITFNADTSSSMQWNFKPQQREIIVMPGDTALAFYTATNPTDQAVVGISTYNVIPFDAGQYFNKIQCFCFEEQRLNPHEQVDMPVFFYIDPDFVEDPKMENVDEIILSYTFFEARDGLKLPVPSYHKA